MDTLFHGPVTLSLRTDCFQERKALPSHRTPKCTTNTAAVRLNIIYGAALYTRIVLWQRCLFNIITTHTRVISEICTPIIDCCHNIQRCVQTNHVPVEHLQECMTSKHKVGDPDQSPPHQSVHTGFGNVNTPVVFLLPAISISKLHVSAPVCSGMARSGMYVWLTELRPLVFVLTVCSKPPTFE